MAIIEEESLTLPFTIRDEQGNILFRDSIQFQTVAELRSASQAEREAMMEQRYQDHLDFLEQAQIAAQAELDLLEQNKAEGLVLPEQPIIGE